MLQYTIIFLILAMVAGWVVKRIIDVFSSKRSFCDGCEGCPFKDMAAGKGCTKHKKTQSQTKKSGQQFGN